MHCLGPMCVERSMDNNCTCGCPGCSALRAGGPVGGASPFAKGPAPVFGEGRIPAPRPRGLLLENIPTNATVQTVTIGFSSASDTPIEPGGTIEIKRSVQVGTFRPQRLEIRPRSALAFDVIGGQIGGRVLLLDGETICLAVFGSAAKTRFAPRVWTLPISNSLKLGESVKMTLRNVSDAPARFCANLIGVGSLP